MEHVGPLSEEVAAGVRTGDPDALAATYRALVGPLTAYVRSQVADAQVAHDVVAETFVELVRSARRITGGPPQIRAWLFRAAHRNLLDHRRWGGRHPEDPTDALPEAPSLVEVEAVAEAGELAETVRSVLAMLPEDQARVLTLRFVGQLSAPEVAEVMGRTEGAVRALQHRATTALARLLDERGVSVEGHAASEPWEAP